MKIKKLLILLMCFFLTSDTCISQDLTSYKRIFDSSIIIECNVPSYTYTIIIFDSNDGEYVKKIHLQNKSDLKTIIKIMNHFKNGCDFSFFMGGYRYSGTYSYNRYGEKTLIFYSILWCYEMTENNLISIKKYLERKEKKNEKD